MAVAGSLTYKAEFDDKEFDSKFEKFKSTLANGGKMIGGTMAVVGAAITGISVAAINSYADYEQLVGGVETLFKDSADIVQEYAANAYKTAGLSANEYMETVTSFSASLLQSLNGDTAKSAEIADMAISDMSDNANKMGTDMALIQSAYQGFAKQNYTMLDNLKLGYGGTKSEMERLLEDATKLSGIEYDIDSLSDIYNAIHVIQTDLGITGTTALEASTTISGSLGMMKSAWTNLITGVADDNANFEELIDNFVESIFTVADNLIPRIKVTIQGIGDLVAQLLQELGPKIIEMLPELVEQFLTIILETIDALVPSIVEVLPMLIQLFLEQIPAIIEAAIQIILALVQGLTDALPQLIAMLPTIITTIVNILIENLPQIILAGIELLLALVMGIVDAIPQLIDMLPSIIDTIINTLTQPDMLGKLINAGIQLLIYTQLGMIKAIPSLVAAIPQIISSIVNGFRNMDWGSLGRNIISGILNGFSSAGNIIWDAIKSVGNSMLSGIKSFFGIASPAKRTKPLGRNVIEGVAVGYEDGEDDLIDTIDDVNDDVYKEMNKALNLETGNITGKAYLDANYSSMRTINIEMATPTIELDGRKVGESTAPFVSKQIKLQGV